MSPLARARAAITWLRVWFVALVTTAPATPRRRKRLTEETRKTLERAGLKLFDPAAPRLPVPPATLAHPSPPHGFTLTALTPVPLGGMSENSAPPAPEVLAEADAHAAALDVIRICHMLDDWSQTPSAQGRSFAKCRCGWECFARDGTDALAEHVRHVDGKLAAYQRAAHVARSEMPS